MSNSTPEGLSTTAAAGLWVDQAAAAVSSATEAATTAASAWQLFTGWYTPAEIAELAHEMAATSLAGQEAVAGAMAEYVSQVVSLLEDNPSVPVPRLDPPSIRNGVDLDQVHARPARAYRVEFAKNQDDEAAIRAAYEREVELMETDLMLAARDAEHQTMEQLGVTHFRRVIHPELSKTGTCLLCIAAAMQVYTIDSLLPLHVRCKCRTMPIIDGNDPGERFNQDDLARIYAEGGATLRKDLSNLRVQVNQHGELGPVLTVKGQRFTGPDDLDGKGGLPAAKGADDADWNDSERATVDYLRSAAGGGHVVEPGGLTRTGRRFDATIDGQRAEIKTLDPGATSSTMRNRANESKRDGGQARYLVFNVGPAGMSEDEARRGVGRIRGAYSKDFDRIRVIGEGFDISEEF